MEKSKLQEQQNHAAGQWLLVKKFIEAIKDDPRITVFHISIYLSLIYQWELKGFEQPLTVFSHHILSHAKISSPATWHKCIRALHDWGYVEYLPSYNNVLGSLVKFTGTSPG